MDLDPGLEKKKWAPRKKKLRENFEVIHVHVKGRSVQVLVYV